MLPPQHPECVRLLEALKPHVQMDEVYVFDRKEAKETIRCYPTRKRKWCYTQFVSSKLEYK